MRIRSVLMLGTAPALLALGGCGGSGGGAIASTPPPAPAPTPVPTPTPTPSPIDYNTAEYQRSNAAVQAQALSAYQAGATGLGVTVGVIDSGVNANSAEFAGRISAFSADLAGSRGIQDEGGHGTAVSDVLLGAKNDSGIQGVAFNATLLVARTDTPGSCTTGGVDAGCMHDDAAIARGVNLAVTAGAKVVNISLGGSPAAPVLRQAIDRATAAGLIIVISGGNNGVKDPAAAANPDPLAQIAIDPVAHGLVLIAGATDATQTLADFSNRAGNGAAFYLTTLGVRVRSIDQTGTSFLYSGTSFSAPVVAGAVALIAQAFPTLTPAQIVDLILRTATDLGAAGVDPVYGHGELNLARAFQPQGATALPGSAVAVSLTDNATLSAPMGDAGQTGLSATIRDMYGRDFAVDLLPTLGRAAVASRLAAGLASTRGAALGTGATTLALSVASGAPDRLTLSPGDAGAAHVLAGSIVSRLGPRTQLAIGFAQGADALARPLTDARAPAFLVAGGAGEGGFAQAPRGAFAVRQALGGIGLTLLAESGAIRQWRRDGSRDHAYSNAGAALDARRGPVVATLRVSRLSERDTVLGASFGPALGGGGAASWFADAGVTIAPFDRFRLSGAWRQGWTRPATGALRESSTIATRALAFDATRDALFARGDSLSLRWSQPLRVTGGGLALTGLGGATRLDLSPSGGERDFEAVYARPFGAGALTLNGYWRRQPGNIATAPDDLGLAIRYSFGF